ncbi:MAG: hypothetical protein ABI629_15770 [bacterium]
MGLIGAGDAPRAARARRTSGGRQGAKPWLALAALLLLLLPGCGDGSGSQAHRPTEAAAVILPVWALLDGDTPVAGARVQVYAGEGHRLERLHPLRGDLKLTADSGLALLEFDHLPPTFLVLVRGGRAGERSLRGSLSVRVRDYDGMVVQVTPVTSLVERWGREDPSLDRTAEVHAALGIPDWADEFDLQATDQWFDGDAFLAYTGGDLAGALPQMLADIKRGESEIFPGDSDQGLEAPPDESKWWQVDVAGLIQGGFKDLATSLISSGVQTGGRYLLGRMFDYWGLKSLSDLVNGKPDTQVIIEMLTALDKKVSTLQATVESTKLAVAESQYSLLVHDVEKEWLVPIDAITLELKAVAAADEREPDETRIAYARQVVSHIKEKLADRFAALQMHRALDTQVPGANDILKAASQVYGARRFFTAESSANINAIYEYFAAYQFRLAILLANYGSSQTGFGKERLQADIDAIQTNINTQKSERLKPAVAADKFVDTRNMRIWSRKPVWVQGQGFKPIEVCRDAPRGKLVCDLNDPNWHDRTRPLATEDEFRKLIDGWKGDNPLQWLRLAVGLITTAPADLRKDWVGHMWLGPEPVDRIRCGFIYCYQRITRVNLSERDSGPHVFTTDLYDFDPHNYYAHAMTVQPVEPGTYWWPFGGL